MASSPARHRLSGRRILMVIAPENFRDEEMDEPREILEREGADVTIACPRAGEARGMLGTRILPQTTLAEVSSRDYDAIVVVGGSGAPRHLWRDEGLLSIVREAHGDGKLVGAICLSGAVLARAGVLADTEATVYRSPEALEELKRGGARYVARAVVSSGNVVTASGPEAAAAFGKALADRLASPEPGGDRPPRPAPKSRKK